MTNYGRDPLEELWKEILEIHWRYLETEESMKKIDERKILEGRLKEYISVVSHDRKFFLPETEQVLRKSITQMKDFSAFKGADGFESISHYANNLFTKPWRKEYRVIKMYSGFYQHEIKNNLMDAEKLFIAMGYKLLPNQTLVLDGPICPDQVTNVSRDALTAFVECQIMKQVNAELTSMSLTTSWLEIYNFRECHIGDSSQSLKGLAQIIQSRHGHMLRKDPFALAIPAPPLPPASSTHHHYQQQQLQQMCSSHCSVHPYTHNQAPPTNSYYNQPCSMHMASNFTPPNSFYQQPQHHLPHSKSLDQYDGKVPPNGVNHHRLSLDHNYKMNQHQHLSPTQQPQPPFDCIDSIAFNHPYNQPNARSPLPYNLSSNLGHHMTSEQYYPTATDPTAGMHNHYPRSYGSDFYHPQMMPHQLPTPVQDYHQKSYEFSDTSSPAMPENELISFGNEPTMVRPKATELKLRSSLKKNTQSTSESAEIEQELNELRALKRGKSNTPASTSSEIKARDGIGNYQAWDYVFQNLEKDNTKNMIGNHDDKVAAELQLENLKLTSNGHGPPKLHQKSNGVAHRMSESSAPYRMTDSSAHHRMSESSAPHRMSESSAQQRMPESSASHRMSDSSAPHRMSESSTHHRMSESSAQRSSGNHTASVQTKTRTKSVSTGTEASNHEHKRTSSVMETSSRSNSHVQKHKLPPQPQIIVPPGEWSCRFCTFLNPDAKKICDMCSKSKDFFLDADKNAASAAAATCV